MLGAGPPRDGIIRTSPGQECSKDKGALPGARRIFVYAARSWSAAGCVSSMWFRPYLLILHPSEERVGLYSAKRQAPVAQWIEHLITVQKVGGSSPFGRAAAPLGAIHRWGFCISTKHSFGSAFFMPIRSWWSRPCYAGTLCVVVAQMVRRRRAFAGAWTRMEAERKTAPAS